MIAARKTLLVLLCLAAIAAGLATRNAALIVPGVWALLCVLL